MNTTYMFPKNNSFINNLIKRVTSVKDIDELHQLEENEPIFGILNDDFWRQCCMAKEFDIVQRTLSWRTIFISHLEAGEKELVMSDYFVISDRGGRKGRGIIVFLPDGRLLRYDDFDVNEGEEPFSPYSLHLGGKYTNDNDSVGSYPRWFDIREYISEFNRIESDEWYIDYRVRTLNTKRFTEELSRIDISSFKNKEEIKEVIAYMKTLYSS